MNTKKIIRTVTSEVVPATAGGIGAKFAKSFAKKATKNEKLQAALPLILGIFLTQSPKTKSIGLGICAVAGADLVATFIPSIQGIEDMDPAFLSGLFGPTLNDDMNSPYYVGSPYDVGDNTLNGFDDVGESYGNY